MTNGGENNIIRRLESLEKKHDETCYRVKEIHTAICGDLKGPGLRDQVDRNTEFRRQQQKWTAAAVLAAITAVVSTAVAWMLRITD